MYPWRKETKAKVKKWDYIKLKSFWRNIINEMKRQLTEQKIITNNISDKGLISKIYKELIQLNIQNTTWLKNGQRVWIDVSQRRYTHCQYEKCSTLLIIKKMQIKTTMKYHLTPVRMAIMISILFLKCENSLTFHFITSSYALFPQNYSHIPFSPEYCNFLKVKVAQSCLTLCNPMDYTVHGILQVRILEWVAYLFSRGSSQPRDWTQGNFLGA